jgi:predicted methyltransferase
MRLNFAFAVAASVLVATLCHTTPARADDALSAVLSSPHRSAANVARDVWRHPKETLAFFGLKPTMTVIEISPGGGWYTEILAPYLRDKGQLILAADDPESTEAYYRRSAERLTKRLQAQPALFDKVKVQAFEVPRSTALGADNSVDMVLTFRNVHNWVGSGEDVVTTVFKNAFTALKPGGVLGVVDHRLPPDRPQDAKASSGYVHVAYVVKLAERAGFKFAGGSEVNANAKDTADHNKGVWALPPTYANKDVDRAKFDAVGESDRFTLKFVKP